MNHAAAVAIWFMYYKLLPRACDAACHPGDGSGNLRSRLDYRRTM